jgi:hypothetical protein
VLLSSHFKNPVANKIFGLFRKFQLLCTTKDHLKTIGLGPVTFDYFSMEPTGLLQNINQQIEVRSAATFMRQRIWGINGCPTDKKNMLTEKVYH